MKRSDFAADPALAVRQMVALKADLELRLRDLELIAGPTEREHSRSLGFSFPPLRGKALLDAMDRAEAAAA